MGNQRRSNQKGSNRNRPASGRSSSGRSAPKGGRRTGASTSGRITRPQASGGSLSARAAAAGGRPSIADAKAWARQPYQDKPHGRQARKEARERKKREPLIAGAPAVIRGGWPGFLILVFGELVTLPIRGNGLVLYWVAIIAYAIAGNRAASASLSSLPRAARDGALAAGMAFALTIPLRFAAHETVAFSVYAVIFQLAAGFIIGGLAAVIAARARRKATIRDA